MIDGGLLVCHYLCIPISCISFLYNIFFVQIIISPSSYYKVSETYSSSIATFPAFMERDFAYPALFNKVMHSLTALNLY